MSEKYVELLKGNYSKYIVNFTGKADLKMSEVENWYQSHIIPVDNFYNFYCTLRSELKNSDLAGVR